MSWSSDLVVLIASRRDNVEKPLGTGTLVAPGRILTARHVVLDAQGREEPCLVVRREGGAWSEAGSVTWCHADGLDVDVAVLEVPLGVRGSGSPDGAAPIHPRALLSERALGANEGWEAQGYPKVRDEAPSTKREKVGGTTRSCSRAEATLFLDAPTHPRVWGGLSGAAVVVGDKVVGVVRSEPKGWDGQRLSATPVAAFLRDRGFREAVGLAEADEEVDARVARVVDGAAALLDKHPHAAATLARILKLAAAPGVVARAVASELVNRRPARDVAMVLNHADAELAKAEALIQDRRAVRSLLLQLLPFAVDLRHLLVKEWSDALGGPSFVELPFRTGTLAEIVLAGIDERWCRFAPLDAAGMPVGAALVGVPAAAQSALIDKDGTKFAQLLVQQIAAELKVDTSYASYRDLRDAARGTLRYHRFEAPPDELVVYYVVLIDANIRGTQGEPDLWALARAVVGEELPSLRLVRLTGDSVEDETALGRHVGHVLNRKPLL